jgi:hypothetical protein
MNSTRFALTGTLGQPVANSLPAQSDSWASRSGFWSQVLRWVNALPVAADDLIERRAGQGTHVLVAQLFENDRDGDWDPLQLVSVDSASVGGGAVWREGPWLVYQPPLGGDPLADDTFTYRVTDGVGAPVVGSVMVRAVAPPLAPASPLRIQALPGLPTQVEVVFQGLAGRSYRLQTAPAVTGPWSAAGTVSATTTGVLSWIEPLAPEPRFFRILEL